MRRFWEIILRVGGDVHSSLMYIIIMEFPLQSEWNRLLYC